MAAHLRSLTSHRVIAAAAALVVALALVALAPATDARSAGADGPWPALGGNAQNSRLSSAALPRNPGVRWAVELPERFQIEGIVGGTAGTAADPIVGPGGELIMRFRDPDVEPGVNPLGLVALSPVDGSVLWDRIGLTGVNTFSCVPAVAGGHLWTTTSEVGADDDPEATQALIAIDPATGEDVPGLRWSGGEDGLYPLNACPGGGIVPASDDLLIVPRRAGGGDPSSWQILDISGPNVTGVAEVDLTDAGSPGTDEYRALSFQVLVAPPGTPGDGHFYASLRSETEAHLLGAIDLDNGEIVREAALPLNNLLAPNIRPVWLVAESGRIVVGTNQGNTSALTAFDDNGTSLSQAWSQGLGGAGEVPRLRRLVDAGAGTLFASPAGSGSNVRGLSLATGAERWQEDLGGRLEIADGSGVGIHQLEVSRSGELAAVDRDGNRVWRLTEPPLLGGRGVRTIVAGPEAGTAYLYGQRGQGPGEPNLIVVTLLDDSGDSLPFDDGTTRVEGVDRFDTASSLSAAVFDSADTVFLATGFDFPDALAGGVAAALEPGPVLLTAGAVITPDTRAELERLRPGRIVVLGGRSAVPEETAQQAAQLAGGAQVVRLGGADRFSTAVEISKATFPEPGTVMGAFVATGLAFPDALAGVPASAAQNQPVLLTADTVVPEVVLDELRRLDVEVIGVLGGPNAVSEQVMAQLRTVAPSVVRISGPSRFDTAVEISKSTFGAPAPIATDTVFIATGGNFPDALSGGAVAGIAPGPVLLTPTDTLLPAVQDELTRLGPRRIIILGGRAAVSEGVEQALGGFIVD